MSGDTLEKIAEKLGYKNHSGVLKRIRKIGQAYEAYTGVDYGFESGKITGCSLLLWQCPRHRRL